MSSWEVSQKACERGSSTLERLVVICGDSQRSLKLLLVRPATVRGRGITNINMHNRPIFFNCYPDFYVDLSCPMTPEALKLDVYINAASFKILKTL